MTLKASRGTWYLLLLCGFAVSGCAHRAARERAGRAILLEKAEADASARTKCEPSDTHAGFAADQSIGVHACGTWLEYSVKPSSCDDDFFLRHSTRDAAEQCRVELKSPE